MDIILTRRLSNVSNESFAKRNTKSSLHVTPKDVKVSVKSASIDTALLSRYSLNYAAYKIDRIEMVSLFCIVSFRAVFKLSIFRVLHSNMQNCYFKSKTFIIHE